jgi:hypothetical protein
LATHGGLSLELCAVIGHLSPMALYRLICALGQQSVVTVLTRCGLPLPVYFLADEKHSHCLGVSANLLYGFGQIILQSSQRDAVVMHVEHALTRL